MISCENWFPLLGITGSARLATSTRWTPSADRPTLARRSTHDRAEGLGARLGITDGADRSRAREQFLRFVCGQSLGCCGTPFVDQPKQAVHNHQIPPMSWLRPRRRDDGARDVDRLGFLPFECSGEGEIGTD